MTTTPKFDEILPEVIVDLQNRGCHSAILYGSRARGDATGASDYDIFAVRSEGEVERDARLFRGAYLDIFIYPEERIREPDESLLQVAGGVVLFQKDRIGDELLRKIGSIDDNGPQRLREDDERARRVWAWKMYARARADDAEGHFRRYWLLTALLEHYFIFRSKWYRGPKASLRWLQRNDAKAFEAFSAALRPGSSFDEIKSLIELVEAT